MCMILIFISGEDLELIWLDSPAVCHDKLVNQQFAACSGSPHNDESSD